MKRGPLETCAAGNATLRLRADGLSTDPATAHIPIIACSAHVLGGAAERALVAGCVAYVGKPCLPRDLLTTVLRVLDQAA